MAALSSPSPFRRGAGGPLRRTLEGHNKAGVAFLVTLEWAHTLATLYCNEVDMDGRDLA